MRRLKPDGGESLYRQARGAGRQVCPLQCCVGQKALGQVCPHPSGLLERSLAIEFMGPQKEPCVVGRGGREMLRKSDQCANHKGTPQLNLGLLQPYSLAVPPAWHPRKPLPSPPSPGRPMAPLAVAPRSAWSKAGRLAAGAIRKKDGLFLVCFSISWKALRTSVSVFICIHVWKGGDPRKEDAAPKCTRELLHYPGLVLPFFVLQSQGWPHSPGFGKVS